MEKKYYTKRSNIHAGFSIIGLVALLIPFSLTGCTIVTYTGSPDGSTKANIYSLGTDKILNGFQAGINKTGDRNITIGSYEGNQTEGMKQANLGLQMLVEGIVKGAVAGAK